MFFLYIGFCLVMSCKKNETNLVKVPDNNFLNAIIQQGFDTDGDGMITFEEAEDIRSLYISDKSIIDVQVLNHLLIWKYLYVKITSY